MRSHGQKCIPLPYGFLRLLGGATKLFFRAHPLLGGAKQRAAHALHLEHLAAHRRHGIAPAECRRGPRERAHLAGDAAPE